MSAAWQYYRAPFKFMLSDKTLFAPSVWLQVREIGLAEDAPPAPVPMPPDDPLLPNSEGFLIRSMRITGEQPRTRNAGRFLCYVAAQYPRYFVDLTQTFEDYQAKFSSKTRSTIRRKVKRFAEHCGGQIDMRVYRSPEEIEEFFKVARLVSASTYQERLLDAGLPDTEEFRERLTRMAGDGQVRGYILFCHGQPVSYLHCPVKDGVLVYQHLGYDARYSQWSVGTILQWSAFESIFAEQRFRLFDFTEGQSEHKRLFATGSVPCANVYFLRNTVMNRLMVHGQLAFSSLSVASGRLLERFGAKSRVKKLLRFGYRFTTSPNASRRTP